MNMNIKTVLLDIEQPATLASVTKIRRLLQQALSLSQADRQTAHQIALCFAEAATNLVQHSVPAARLFKVKFSMSSQAWLLTLEDDGGSWDPTQLNPATPDTLLDAFTLDALTLEAESGRGIALLRTQCSDLAYQAADTTANAFNCLTITWTNRLNDPRPTIVIVDDEPSQQRLYQTYLTEDFQILTADNGQQALAVIRHQHIDLVLSDIQMPGMNGLEFREQLNSLSPGAAVPFIFLTTANTSEMLQQAATIGIDDYLTKPVSKQMLLHTVHRVLERSKQVYRHLTGQVNRQIASALSPQLPANCPGWRLAVRQRNTGIGGGDFVIAQPCENSFFIAVTDIMGHNDTAKFFSYAYAGYLRGMLLNLAEIDCPPDEVLRRLSMGARTDHFLSQVTLTCSALCLHPDGEVVLASAGHPPPLLITKQGIQAVNISGILPGLLDDPHYPTITQSLEPGQRLAVISDGLFESAMTPSGRQELERKMLDALRKTLSQPLDDAMAHVMQVFDDFTGGKPNDDALLLLIERDCE
ncbi:SpoIIE family protein phosphatase [Photobacterium galatheae]|uniref:SpoIIE family protein phosphatase n=1 Tax=Photobacterium galatheae TaxID=1654360 RepID=UPI00137661AB|nr:SpoIIE family protein phosphatase [Photobacterium galatheae]MCM0146964.1 response regulator [Photobacterium galatheae]